MSVGSGVSRTIDQRRLHMVGAAGAHPTSQDVTKVGTFAGLLAKKYVAPGIATYLLDGSSLNNWGYRIWHMQPS